MNDTSQNIIQNLKNMMSEHVKLSECTIDPETGNVNISIIQTPKGANSTVPLTSEPEAYKYIVEMSEDIIKKMAIQDVIKWIDTSKYGDNLETAKLDYRKDIQVIIDRMIPENTIFVNTETFYAAHQREVSLFCGMVCKDHILQLTDTQNYYLRIILSKWLADNCICHGERDTQAQAIYDIFNKL